MPAHSILERRRRSGSLFKGDLHDEPARRPIGTAHPGTAYKIWDRRGSPDGKDQENWEIAKMAIAEADGLPSTLKKPDLPQPEPIEAVRNQAEFPTLTDQGEGQLPGEEKWR